MSLSARGSVLQAAAITILFVSGCGFITLWKTEGDHGGNPCDIAPPATYIGNRAAALKVGADLSAFVKAPIKANYEDELKEVIERTFHTIPDAAVTCHMLLQSVNCLGARPEGRHVAERLVDLARDACRQAEVIPPTSPVLSGEWVGISNEIRDENLNHQVTEEVVHLEDHDGKVSGTSRRGDYAWANGGYFRDGHLVLAYRTVGQTGRGFGTYLLVDKEGRGRELIGYREGRECVINQIVRCPVSPRQGYQRIQGTGTHQEAVFTLSQSEVRSGGALSVFQVRRPNHALQPTPWNAVAFPSPLVRRG